MAVHVTHLHLGARMDSTPGQGRLVLVIAQLTSAILRPFLDFFFFFDFLPGWWLDKTCISMK